jgi:hypothetical protein
MRRSLFLSLTAAAVLATSGAAQAGPCGDKIPKLPTAGNWVRYHSDSSGDIKMLYLGHETGGERLEMTVNRTERNGRQMNGIVQMVVPGYPYEMTQVTEMVMQMGDQPPMKMSGQMLSMMRSRMPANNQLSADACGRLVVVGRESITVPAGTFSTTHYRDAQSGTDVWVDKSVPFGMVKVINGGRTMVLADKGTGGHTAITGTPQEMGAGMRGGPGRPPR